VTAALSLTGGVSKIASDWSDLALDLLVFAHDLVRKVCQLFGIMR
jgi:hypothetical protein